MSDIRTKREMKTVFLLIALMLSGCERDERNIYGELPGEMSERNLMYERERARGKMWKKVNEEHH